MSQSTPESPKPDTRESDRPASQPDTDRPEPLNLAEPQSDIIEKGDKHDYEIREAEMETKDSHPDSGAE